MVSLYLGSEATGSQWMKSVSTSRFQNIQKQRLHMRKELQLASFILFMSQTLSHKKCPLLKISIMASCRLHLRYVFCICSPSFGCMLTPCRSNFQCKIGLVLIQPLSLYWLVLMRPKMKPVRHGTSHIIAHQYDLVQSEHLLSSKQRMNTTMFIQVSFRACGGGQENSINLKHSQPSMKLADNGH